MPDLPKLTPAYTTKWGRCIHGDSIAVMRQLKADTVSLVMTSPPFALKRQKAYGNVTPGEYLDWILPFTDEIFRILRPDGSFVLDLGGAWNPARAHARSIRTS